MTIKSFLCVDDDSEFQAYILTTAEPYHLKIDTCTTLESARNKIKTIKYDAFIVDLNLSDGSGFDLIQEIREIFGSHTPIAVVSGVFRDEESFKLLKDKYEINYILDKPIYPQQLESL